jgi:hypothetical protein
MKYLITKDKKRCENNIMKYKMNANPVRVHQNIEYESNKCTTLKK